MPRYDVRCQFCGRQREVQLSYQQYDDRQRAGFIASGEEYRCPAQAEDPARIHGYAHCHWVFAITEVPPVHFKGYGFYKTDNLSSSEKYDRDHFDGSGNNPEIKAMERRIKDPQSTVPARPAKTTY